MDFTTLAWIDSTGYHFADFPTFLSAYQAGYQGIYGSDAYLGADSQDGQWVTLEAQASYDMAALGSLTYNSLSPVTAQGVGLARGVKWNGLTKGVATNSTVILTVIGSSGTVITDGIAIDNLEQQWLLPASVSIPGGGSINVTATAQNQGAVSAAPSTITTIFTPTNGWQSVNNSSAAVVGDPVETDGALRVRQANSTNLPALSLIAATAGALSNLVGVTGVKYYENDTDGTVNSLPANSVCFVVNGGASLQTVANTIGLYKTPGTVTSAGGSANAQTEQYTDPNGMVININFVSPAVPATVNVDLSVTPLAGWSSNYVVQIQAAITAFIETYGIGATLPWSEFYLPAYLAGTSAQGTYSVSALTTELNSGGFATSDIALNFDAVPVAGTINVTVL